MNKSNIIAFLKETTRKFYYLLNFLFIVLYIISFLGYGEKSHMHLDLLNEIYKIFIALILIYFFNPFHKEKLDDFHKKIAFSAGILLIFTPSFAIIIKNLPIIKKMPYLNKFLSAKKMFM